MRRPSRRARKKSCVRSNRVDANFFDFLCTFVLDTVRLRFIIYIWYEDGPLRPSLVKLDGHVELALLSGDRRKVPEAKSADIGRACQAAATVMHVSALAVSQHEGGDNRQWRRKP